MLHCVPGDAPRQMAAAGNRSGCVAERSTCHHRLALAHTAAAAVPHRSVNASAMIAGGFAGFSYRVHVSRVLRRDNGLAEPSCTDKAVVTRVANRSAVHYGRSSA